jgi:hypothetical protein
MRNRQTRLTDAIGRLFLDVTGELPDEASLLRMRRVSGALNLRDNDALWSMIAVLEFYARLYEAMPNASGVRAMAVSTRCAGKRRRRPMP